jgi:hypothetical protein
MVLKKSNKHPRVQEDIIDISSQANSAQSSSPAAGPKGILTNPLTAPVRVAASPAVSAPFVTQPPVTASAKFSTVSALLVAPVAATSLWFILLWMLLSLVQMSPPLFCLLYLLWRLLPFQLRPVPVPDPTLMTPNAAASVAPQVLPTAPPPVINVHSTVTQTLLFNGGALDATEDSNDGNLPLPVPSEVVRKRNVS